MSSPPLSVVILISGRGSNMRAIVEARDAGLPVNIRCVISSKADAPGLAYARDRDIPTEVVSAADYADAHAYDTALQACIDRYQPQLVVLAGFMRILTAELVTHFLGRMINIHPSLLPAFKGLRTHQRALDAGVREHGASVHFVTPELDNGPVIAQVRVEVKADDNAQSLAARVLDQEHRLYPQVIGWIQQQRVKFAAGQAMLDGKPLTTPVILPA